MRCYKYFTKSICSGKHRNYLSKMNILKTSQRPLQQWTHHYQIKYPERHRRLLIVYPLSHFHLKNTVYKHASVLQGLASVWKTPIYSSKEEEILGQFSATKQLLC